MFWLENIFTMFWLENFNYVFDYQVNQLHILTKKNCFPEPKIFIKKHFEKKKFYNVLA